METMMTDDLQIVRGNYFYRDDLPRLTLANDMLSFNNLCVKLLDVEYVIIVPSKENKTIRIRPSTRYDFNSVRWYNLKKGIKRSRKIKSRIFTAMFFRDMGFDFDHKYVLNGEYRKGEVPELIFYAEDPKVFVLDETAEKKRFEERYQGDWQDSYGIPLKEHEDHKLHTFEEYTVLDITLERVIEVEEESDEEAERLNELTSKYVRDGGYYG